MILTETFKRKQVSLPYLQEQVHYFAYVLGCEYWLDTRGQKIQIYDNQPCKEKTQYIKHNLKLIIQMSLSLDDI